MGQRAPADADHGRPRRTSRRRWSARSARPPSRPAPATSCLVGIGVGSPGDVDDAPAPSRSARNLPDWDGPFPLARRAAERARAPRSALGNDVQVATDAEFALGAGRAYTLAARRLLGHRRRRRRSCSTASRGRARRPGEIGHIVVQHRRAALPLRAARLPRGIRRPRRAWSGARASSPHRASRPSSSRSWRSAARDRLSSGVWARALDAGDPLAHRLIGEAIEALGAGVASAVNLLDVEAVVIGGGMGVRLGEPYAQRIERAMMPHLFADSAPARRPCRRARRPRRRDRRLAARQPLAARTRRR